MTIDKKKAAVAAGIVALVLLVGWIAKATLFSKPAPKPVTAEATIGDVEETVLATGTLEPIRLVSVGAQVTGQVRRLHVVLGQQVVKGQPIAEIDSAPQENALRTAQAQLANIRAQRGQIDGTLNQAQRAFQRQSTMLAANATSQADYDTADASLRSARSQLAANTAQITSAEVAVETAQINLSYARIVAPISGTVVAIVTEEGQTVNAMQAAPVIVKIGQLDTMTVKAEISEADVIKVRPGLPVYFTVLGDSRRRYNGSLRTVEPAPESIKTESAASTTSASSTAVYYNGLFDVPNTDGRLRTSMTAQVSIVLGEARNVLTIPSSAVGKPGPDGTYRMTVQGPKDETETRNVKIGLNNGSRAQVLSGLKAGDKVVLASTAAESSFRPPTTGGLGGGGGGGRPPAGGGGRP